VLATVAVGYTRAGGSHWAAVPILAFFFWVLAALLVFAYRSERRRSPSGWFGAAPVASFLLGSISVAVTAAWTWNRAAELQPTPLKLLWLLCIAAAVSGFIAPRFSGAALAVPLALAGLLWLALAQVLGSWAPVFVM
jgi:hypothetical protein